jgi:hypothetical protein
MKNKCAHAEKHRSGDYNKIGHDFLELMAEDSSAFERPSRLQRPSGRRNEIGSATDDGRHCRLLAFAVPSL